MRTTYLVVSKSDERVVLLLTPERDYPRSYAIIGEEEAFCACNSLRRMLASRDERSVRYSASEGLHTRRVDHQDQPIELHFDDEDDVLVVDLGRDEAAALADALWGAYRSSGEFHCVASLIYTPRLVTKARTTSKPAPAIEPPHGAEAQSARTRGRVARRLRGEGEAPKS